METKHEQTARRQKPLPTPAELERSDRVEDATFSHHQHYQHPQPPPPPPAAGQHHQDRCRCPTQQQFATDTFSAGQRHYHVPGNHRQLLNQNQPPGHHYCINDLLSTTAVASANSFISSPELAIASSIQLLNGQSISLITVLVAAVFSLIGSISP